MFEREFDELPAGVKEPLVRQFEDSVRDLVQKLKYAKYGKENTIDTLTLTQLCVRIALCLEFAERIKQAFGKDLSN